MTCAAPHSTVSVLDAASGEQRAAIPAGHTAMSPVISPDGQRLYVCNRFDNDVAVIDLPAGREVARVPAVREPVAAALTPDGQMLLVANHLPNARTDGAANMDVRPVVTAVDTPARFRQRRSSWLMVPTACGACASRRTANTRS